MPTTARAYAAFSPTEPLGPHSITRRDPGPRDVAIEIDYCGICHSDIHFLRGEWGRIPYPAIAGHEIIGRVTAVGAHVTRHRGGDTVGVGCMVDSCRSCPSCRESLENDCTGGGSVGTFMGVDKHTGGPTYGGYSSAITVDEDFVLRIPGNLDLAGAAPLLRAGITTWSPFRHWEIGKGSTVGVVGQEGLGHMGVKLAAAMGAEVVVFTTSPHKVEDARALVAHDVVISTDEEAMATQGGRFDFVLDTVRAPRAGPVHRLPSPRRYPVPSGGAGIPHPSPAVMPLIAGRRSVAGSLIGGIAETQEMLDFCGQHGITSQVETITMDGINEAQERMLRSDVKYRFVIEMQGATQAPDAGCSRRVGRDDLAGLESAAGTRLDRGGILPLMRIESHYRHRALRGAKERRPGPLARGLLAVLAVMYSVSAFVAPTAHGLDTSRLDTGHAGLEAAAFIGNGSAGIDARLAQTPDPEPSAPHHHDPDCVTCLLLTLPGIDGQAGVELASGTSEACVQANDAGVLLDRSPPTLHLQSPPTA